MCLGSASIMAPEVHEIGRFEVCMKGRLELAFLVLAKAG